MVAGSPAPEIFEWHRYPALFERVSGLVILDQTSAKLTKFFGAIGAGKMPLWAQSIYRRLGHEVTHYMQFFGCGCVTKLCARQFDAVRRASPFPFTEESLAAWLAAPKPRLDVYDDIKAELNLVGASGLTTLQLIEGAAFLHQTLLEMPAITPLAYLQLLDRDEHGDLYGRLFRTIMVALPEALFRETLFLSQLALEYAAPEEAIGPLIEMRRKHFDLKPDDLDFSRTVLLAGLVFDHEHLGSAFELAQRGEVYHLLLMEPWIYHEEPLQPGAAREALWGQRPATLDFLNHAEILVKDAIWHARPAKPGRRDEMEVRLDFARMSLQFGGGLMEELNNTG